MLAAAATALVLLVVDVSAAHAASPGGPAVLAAASIQAVVNNIRLWLLALIGGVATLFLTVGAFRYLAADGDPGDIERAKRSLKSAAYGYALALLAPLFVTIVGQWVA